MLTAEEKSNARRLLSAIEEIRKVDELMPIQQVAILLNVAVMDAPSLTEVQKKVGLASSSTSRGITHLSTLENSKRKGLGLIDYKPDPEDRRRNEHHLSPQGETLLRTMLEKLRPASAS